MKKEPEATDALFAPLNYLILKQRNRSIGLEKFKGSSESELQTQAILLLKSMSERVGSDMQRLQN